MKQLFSLLAFLFFCQLIKAQEFATPTETPTGKALVTTVDGKTAYGKFTSFTWEARGLGNFRIKDSATGETIKFEPENVKTFKFISKPMFGFMRKKGNDAVENEYITFNQIPYPEKTDKLLLLELLNPGFSNKIQVYDHKVGTKSSTSILGITTEYNDSRSYIIVINGVSSFVEKKNYKTEYFDKIFASCPELMSMPENEVKFKDFAKHVNIFEKCK